jgi:GNAT superfamily N-acetyltransferase
VGEIAAEPVVTGMSVTVDSAVGIFNVATVEHHRRRGYGAALTARAVNDAVRDGAAWAWLQSSDDGYGVYEHLGFSTVERWPCWISPATAA